MFIKTKSYCHKLIARQHHTL